MEQLLEVELSEALAWEELRVYPTPEPAQTQHELQRTEGPLLLRHLRAGQSVVSQEERESCEDVGEHRVDVL